MAQQEDWVFLYVEDHADSSLSSSHLLWIELRQNTHRSIYEPSEPILLTNEQRSKNYKGMKWVSATTSDRLCLPRSHANASLSLLTPPSNVNYKLASAQEVVQDMKAFLHSFS